MCKCIVKGNHRGCVTLIHMARNTLIKGYRLAKCQSGGGLEETYVNHEGIAITDQDEVIHSKKEIT